MLNLQTNVSWFKHYFLYLELKFIHLEKTPTVQYKYWTRVIFEHLYNVIPLRTWHSFKWLRQIETPHTLHFTFFSFFVMIFNYELLQLNFSTVVKSIFYVTNNNIVCWFVFSFTPTRWFDFVSLFIVFVREISFVSCVFYVFSRECVNLSISQQL